MSRLSAEAREELADVKYHDAPSILLLAASDPDVLQGRRTVEAARCRVAAAGGVTDAAERLRTAGGIDATLAEISEDPGEALDQLIDNLCQGARDGRRSVVVAPAALRERVLGGRSIPTGLHFLVDPSGFERILALRIAVERRPPRLQDVKGRAAPTLQELSQQIGRIAMILSNLSENERPVEADPKEEVSAAYVRSLIAARRRRDRLFENEKTDLFSDPAWDMLLDLYAARLEGRRVAVSSLCIAAAVPSTTALRWIRIMCDHGLFVRTADPEDGRRFFIHLSDMAVEKMDSFFRSAQRAAAVSGF